MGQRGAMGDGNGTERGTVLGYPPILHILAPAQILAHPPIPLILVQVRGAGEFNSPLPWKGMPVRPSPLST